MRSPWILFPERGSSGQVRLFCLPHAGSGIAHYCRWWRDVRAGIEICPIKLPGRESRYKETPVRRLLPLAETIAQEMRHCAEMPYAIFGHSMGALLGFEVVRALRRQGGAPPLGLFASGFRPPQLVSDMPLHSLPEPEFLDGLARRYGTVPYVLTESAEMRELFLPILRADLEMCETYHYCEEVPLECPIHAFGGLDDAYVSRKQLALWEKETLGTFELTMLPGDHLFLHSAGRELVEIVGAGLAHWLEARVRGI